MKLPNLPYSNLPLFDSIMWQDTGLLPGKYWSDKRWCGLIHLQRTLKLLRFLVASIIRTM